MTLWQKNVTTEFSNDSLWQLSIQFQNWAKALCLSSWLGSWQSPNHMISGNWRNILFFWKYKSILDFTISFHELTITITFFVRTKMKVHVSCLFKDTRINKAPSKSQSYTNKLKCVLFLIVDYDSCFFCLSPPFSSLIFLLFAFFAWAYTNPTCFVKLPSLLVKSPVSSPHDILIVYSFQQWRIFRVFKVFSEHLKMKKKI